MEQEDVINRFTDSIEGLNNLINYLTQPRKESPFFKTLSDGTDEFNEDYIVSIFDKYERSRDEVSQAIQAKELYPDEEAPLQAALEYTGDLSVVLKNMTLTSSSIIDLAFSVDEADQSNKIQLIDGLLFIVYAGAFAWYAKVSRRHFLPIHWWSTLYVSHCLLYIFIIAL